MPDISLFLARYPGQIMLAAAMLAIIGLGLLARRRPEHKAVPYTSLAADQFNAANVREDGFVDRHISLYELTPRRRRSTLVGVLVHLDRVEAGPVTIQGPKLRLWISQHKDPWLTIPLSEVPADAPAEWYALSRLGYTVKPS